MPRPQFVVDASAAEAALDTIETACAGKQDISAKGQANGYASLGADGKVPSAQLSASQGGAAWGDITGTLSEQLDLQTELDFINSDLADTNSTLTTHTNAAAPHSGHAASVHSHAASSITSGVLDIARIPTGTTSTTVSLGNHTHSGGSDPWTVIRLSAEFPTTSNAAQNITGLAFTPTASKTYEFYATLMCRTATATVGPRPGIGWPTGCTDGVASVQMTSSATANVFANGNISASVLAPVGGVPTTTASWPAVLWGVFITGATPSGDFRLQLASETNGTQVRAMAGSFLRYREIA